jgi:ABC-2 type transport system permease protein
MAVKGGSNGFGRIGRNVFRAAQAAGTDRALAPARALAAPAAPAAPPTPAPGRGRARRAGGAAAFCCMGIALTAAIPSQDAAAPVVNALLLPLYFLSGVFIPEDELPDGVVNFAHPFPVRDFFEAFFTAYMPSDGGSGVAWGNLAVVAIWGVAGLLLAIRFFRWTPRGG